MIEVDVKQGSEQWLKMRLGKITGTKLKEVFKSDNLPLIYKLIAEIDSEEIEETFTTKQMQRGKDLEPIAREIYQQVKEIEIEDIGFCLSDSNDYLAYSTDGFTKCRTGGIEIKCPNTETHVKYISQNQLPNDYKYQVYTSFLVNSKLQWLDFISFDPRFKSKPMFIKRINRVDIIEDLEKTESELNKFIIKFEKYYKNILS
jgi:hypothetical protein